MKSIISTTQDINIEDIPDKLADAEVWPKLEVNGGNVLSVDKDTNLGKFLIKNGYDFGDKDWGWLVVYR